HTHTHKHTHTHTHTDTSTHTHTHFPAHKNTQTPHPQKQKYTHTLSLSLLHFQPHKTISRSTTPPAQGNIHLSHTHTSLNTPSTGQHSPLTHTHVPEYPQHRATSPSTVTNTAFFFWFLL